MAAAGCDVLRVAMPNLASPPSPSSGTAIMQDGNTMRNNYGCDLDSLTTGSRIGMMRTAKGDLHYFINGVDQGVACSGLPPGKGENHGVRRSVCVCACAYVRGVLRPAEPVDQNVSSVCRAAPST